MKKIFAIFSMFMLLVTASCYAKTVNTTINTAQIIQDTFAGMSSCMHYQITGLCFWYHGYHVSATLKVKQYLPDAIVTAYTKPTNDPWWFAKTLIDPAAYQAGKFEAKHFTGFKLGYGEEHDNTHTDINDRFHEVDIIGNPALSLIGHSHVMLPSAASPYSPYYLSLLDAYLWRFPGLEKFYPGAFIPDIDDIGVMVLHDWGQLYPRNGYVNQPDDAKAAAVDALRAADIITQPGQPHLYQPLSNICGQHCFASPVQINSKKTQFQMIYPKLETKCTIFGKSDAFSLQPWEQNAATKGHDRYVWILWRQYHGCIQGQGKYIGST